MGLRCSRSLSPLLSPHPSSHLGSREEGWTWECWLQKLQAVSRQSFLYFNFFFFWRYLLDVSFDNTCFSVYVDNTLTLAVTCWCKSEDEPETSAVLPTALLLLQCLWVSTDSWSAHLYFRTARAAAYLSFCLWLYFCGLWSPQIIHTQRSGAGLPNLPKAQGCCMYQQWQASVLQDNPGATVGHREGLDCGYLSDESYKTAPSCYWILCIPHAFFH